MKLHLFYFYHHTVKRFRLTLDLLDKAWYNLSVRPNAGPPNQRETFKSGAKTDQPKKCSVVDAYLLAYLDRFRSVQALS